MNVYKLTRPSLNDKDVELIIYAKTLNDVFKILDVLDEKKRIATRLEIIPIVHFEPKQKTMKKIQ